jgi:hypothetical protein
MSDYCVADGQSDVRTELPEWAVQANWFSVAKASA